MIMSYQEVLNYLNFNLEWLELGALLIQDPNSLFWVGMYLHYVWYLVSCTLFAKGLYQMPRVLCLLIVNMILFVNISKI